MENASYIDANTGKMVLRCRKYPKQGSREWIVSGDSIEFRIVGKEDRSRTYLISDITRVRLNVSVIGSFELRFRVNGSTIIIPIIMFETTNSVNVAQAIYDYIGERNPNVLPPKRDTATPKTPRQLLKIMGVIYLIYGVFTTVAWSFLVIWGFAEFGRTFMPAFLWFTVPIFSLLTGIIGVKKLDELKRARILRAFAVMNFLFFEFFRRAAEYSFSIPRPLTFILGSLPIFLFLAAQGSYKYHKNLPQEQESDVDGA